PGVPACSGSGLTALWERGQSAGAPFTKRLNPVNQPTIARKKAGRGSAAGGAKVDPSLFLGLGGRSHARRARQDPEQGRSDRATPNRRHTPRLRLVRRPTAGSRQVARRQIKQPAL